jgi:hypothetical protein
MGAASCHVVAVGARGTGCAPVGPENPCVAETRSSSSSAGCAGEPEHDTPARVDHDFVLPQPRLEAALPAVQVGAAERPRHAGELRGRHVQREADGVRAGPQGARRRVGVDGDVLRRAARGTARGQARRRHRPGHPVGVREVGRLVVGLVAVRVEELHRLRQRMQLDAHRVGRESRRRRRLHFGVDESRLRHRHQVFLQAPEEYRQVRQVVAGHAAGGRLEIGDVTERIERGIHERQRGGVPHRDRAAARRSADVRRRRHRRLAPGPRRAGGKHGLLRRQPADPRAQVVEVLVPRQAFAHLHRMHRPARERVHQRLHRAQRALAPAVMNGARDVGAQGARLAREVGDAQQVGEVGDDPVVAGFDEEVVVERVDAGVDRALGLVQDVEVSLQLSRRRLLGVADAVNLGQSVEQPLADSHVIAPGWRRPRSRSA